MKKTLLWAAGLAALSLVAVCIAFSGAPLISAVGLPSLAMATLAVAKTRDYQLGDQEEYPVIASDIIYQGGRRRRKWPRLFPSARRWRPLSGLCHRYGR